MGLIKRGKMKISCLSSGSSGNCFYVSNKNSAVLIDCGISSKKVEERLFAIKQNPEKIKGILVTHEHGDHTKGVDVFARKFNIPIFATKGTIQNSFLCSDKELICPIRNNETLEIGKMEIEAFSKAHDCEDPISFKIKNGKTLSIITDIGHSCKNVIDAVSDSDFLVIEANHDIDMLKNGKYPWFLKNRILGENGHLSNYDSGLCVMEHGKRKLKNVVLAHLSENNNTSLAALSTFSGLIRERQDLRPKLSLSLKTRATLLFSV